MDIKSFDIVKMQLFFAKSIATISRFGSWDRSFDGAQDFHLEFAKAGNASHVNNTVLFWMITCSRASNHDKAFLKH